MERSRSRVRHAIAVTKHVQDNQGWKINHRVSPDMHDNPGSDPPLLNTRGGGLARANERAQVGGGERIYLGRGTRVIEVANAITGK